MESPISNTVMMGVVLIALAAVIGMCFGVFVISKDVVNEGTVGYQENMKNIQDLNINGYNDTVVVGREIDAFFKNNKHKELAVLVNTIYMKENKVISYSSDKALHYIDDVPYINYGCIIGYTPNGEMNEEYEFKKGSKLLIKGDTTFKKDGSGVVTSNMFVTDDLGGFLRDDATGEWSKKESIQYINVNAMFNANLIRNEIGDILGVYFTQLEN